VSESVAEHTPWYMRGNFAPVMDELSEEKLAVTGQVPRELNGLYLRNGGNPRHGTPPHWFFGDGMVHGVRLREGRADWYRNRWVRTSKLERDLDPMDTASLMDRHAGVANTHVIGHAGRSRQPDGPGRERREHPRDRPRGAHPRARGGPLSLSALAGARDARLPGLRGQAHQRFHRPPQALPGDERAALLRLLWCTAPRSRCPERR
jgi:hypothetical protein